MILRWLVAATLLLVVALPPAAAQPPSVWHPYRGGTNCIQVADSQGRFNCAPGTTVDPATGNVNISGVLSFGASSITGVTQYGNGIVLAPLTVQPKSLGAGDLVISLSGDTIAPSGPLVAGYATFRVRQPTPGRCSVVVVAGSQFREWTIPVLDTLGRVTATVPCS